MSISSVAIKASVLACFIVSACFLLPDFAYAKKTDTDENSLPVTTMMANCKAKGENYIGIDRTRPDLGYCIPKQETCQAQDLCLKVSLRKCVPCKNNSSSTTGNGSASDTSGTNKSSNTTSNGSASDTSGTNNSSNTTGNGGASDAADKKSSSCPPGETLVTFGGSKVCMPSDRIKKTTSTNNASGTPGTDTGTNTPTSGSAGGESGGAASSSSTNSSGTASSPTTNSGGTTSPSTTNSGGTESYSTTSSGGTASYSTTSSGGTASYSTTNSGALFKDLASHGGKIFTGMREIIYAVSGFGVIAIAIGAIFGNVNWKWLTSIVIGLFVIAGTATIINYMVGEDVVTPEMIQDSLKFGE